MAHFQDEERFGRDFLDTIIEWIGYNLKPSEVFDDEDLKEWAIDNGYVEEE